MKRPSGVSLWFAAVLSLVACRETKEADTTAAQAPVAAAPAVPVTTTAPAAPPPAEVRAAQFTDLVWQVQSSSAVAPGTVYAFLDDGTLVIEAPQSTPSYGRWQLENGALTLVEEGRPYPTDILELSETTMHLRSHNPGEPVELRLVAVPEAALPRARRAP